jgi:Zn-dependent M28 family amino/carboxypeptidase
MKPMLFVALLAVTIAPALAQQRAPHNDSIRQNELRADLFFLAGDAMKGRLTDTDENRATADYIRSRFERAGLKPAAGNSFFQNYDLMTSTIAAEGNAIEIGQPDRSSRHLRLGTDFYPHRFSASGQASAGVTFVGFGISASHLQYDDYANRTSIAGRIALILDHEPGERDPNSPFDGVVTTEPAAAWRKVLAAQEHGAVGVLFVSDVHNHPGAANFEQTARNYWPATTPRVKSYTLAAWSDRIRIPVAQVSPAIAAMLVAESGTTFDELSKSAETARGSTPVMLTTTQVVIRTAVDRHIVADRNVVALLEGGDPRLKNEWVLVTAHFDHDGVNGTQILNGADDNGSGTVALLAIADAFAATARDGQRPKRSVLFAAWNSEERGLLGAWAYTEQPLAPLNSIAAVLNMDMIGRNEEVQVGGGNRFNGLEVQTAESNANAVNMMGFSRAPDVAAAVDRANAGISLEIKKRYDNNVSNLIRRSDQWPFLQRGVPALGFMTGLHPDYHTQYDRPEKINYAKMEKVARLIHQASWDLANADARPRAPVTHSVSQ